MLEIIELSTEDAFTADIELFCELAEAKGMAAGVGAMEAKVMLGESLCEADG